MSDLSLATRLLLATTKEKKGDIAKRIGMAQSTLSSIAAGRIQPTLANMERIANGYNIKLSEFVAMGE